MSPRKILTAALAVLSITACQDPKPPVQAVIPSKVISQPLARVVEMRYFAALDNEQIAECLGVTDRTVRRDLEKVRLLLLDAIG